MAEHYTLKSTNGEEEPHIPPRPRPAVSTLHAPVVQSSETDSSGGPRTLRDEVVEDLAPSVGVSSTFPSGNANLRVAAGTVNSSEAPAMAEQSGRSDTAAYHPSIQIADSNTPQVAQNTAVTQGQSHGEQPPEGERTTSRSPVSSSSPTAGDGNETDETEYCDGVVVLDGTNEGIDLNRSLPWLRDDNKAWRRKEGP